MSPNLFFLIFLIKKITPISEQKEYHKIMFHWKCRVIKILLFFCCKLFQLFETPWTAAHQVSLPFTISQSLLKLTSIELVMPSNHLILHFPLLLLLSIFPSIRVFPNESAFCIRWPKYCSLSFSNSPSNEYSGLISSRLTVLISLQSKGLSRVFSSTRIQKPWFFVPQPSLRSNSHIHTFLEKP